MTAKPASRWTLGKLGAALLALAVAACSPVDPAATESKAPSEAELLEIAHAIHRKALVLDAHADIVMPTTASNFLSADGT